MVDNQQSQWTPRTSHAWTRNAALRATAATHRSKPATLRFASVLLLVQAAAATPIRRETPSIDEKNTKQQFLLYPPVVATSRSSSKR